MDQINRDVETHIAHEDRRNKIAAMDVQPQA
jgi:hypothetical protein